jgi:hypothetical protein
MARIYSYHQRLGRVGVKRIHCNSDVIRVVSDNDESDIVDLVANNEVVLAYECRNPRTYPS